MERSPLSPGFFLNTTQLPQLVTNYHWPRCMILRSSLGTTFHHHEKLPVLAPLKIGLKRPKRMPCKVFQPSHFSGAMLGFRQHQEKPQPFGAEELIYAVLPSKWKDAKPTWVLKVGRLMSNWVFCIIHLIQDCTYIYIYMFSIYIYIYIIYMCTYLYLYVYMCVTIFMKSN